MGSSWTTPTCSHSSTTAYDNGAIEVCDNCGHVVYEDLS